MKAARLKNLAKAREAKALERLRTILDTGITPARLKAHRKEQKENI